jgi:hypothetical protein
MHTYTKCLEGTSFHPGPPSLRALTRSISSAWWSSTTKSTNWLLSDFAELDDDDFWRRKLGKGTRDFDFEREDSPFCD